jgi:hypothetical protein
MAVCTTNIRISFLEFALIQNVFPLVVSVMTVRTGEVPSHVDFVGKHDRGPLLSSIGFPVVDYDLLWLCSERRYDHTKANGCKKHSQGLVSHAPLSLPERVFSRLSRNARMYPFRANSPYGQFPQSWDIRLVIGRSFV